MPQLIATSWDKNQLLILAAKTKKGKVFFENAVRILPDQPADQPDAVPVFTPETVKAKLRHFVQHERLGKYDTVVVLGRDDVEVRSMVFPPVPNDELPDMAKFQASKEFTEYDQAASLDFVLFDGAKKDKKHILAAALTRTRRETVEDVISGAGLDLQRIVLGPCESAKRFATITVQQRTGGSGKTTLLVEMNEFSATLSLLYRGQPAFVRMAHFQKPVWAELEQADTRQFENADELANWKWLTSEFKRTVVAAINDVPSEKIDEIVLCGVGERYEKLMVLLTEALAVPVSLFNVWRFENREGEIRNRLPAFEEQFLPLIGALTPALTEKPNALDFKNPKRKPEKRTNRNLITAIVAACVLLIIITGSWGFYRRTVIEDELSLLERQQKELREATVQYEPLKAQNESINSWKKGEVNWLKQLEWLSSNMPPSQDVIVTGTLTLNSPVNATPILKFTADTRGQTIVPELEKSLRDDTHIVTSPKVIETQNQPYTHRTDITVRIVPPPKQTTQQVQALLAPVAEENVAEASAEAATPDSITPNSARPATPPNTANERRQPPRNRNAVPPPDVVPPNETGETNAPVTPEPPAAPSDTPAEPVAPSPPNASATPETAVEPVVPAELATADEPAMILVVDAPNMAVELDEPSVPYESDTPVGLDEFGDESIPSPDAKEAGEPSPDVTGDETGGIETDDNETHTNGGTS